MGAARYKPYQNSKSSGLEWLGAIPAHWDVLQSRRMFAQRKERAKPGDEQLTSSQKYGIIYQKEFMERENQRVVQVITGSEILKHVEANDFVISMRSFQGGLEWCKYPGCVSSAYIGLIPQKHVDPSFFSYLFKSKQYVQALQSTSNLVRDGQALRYENFSQVPLPVVPLPEQTKIAAFLDYETGKIDALIAKQEQLIALLEEKRQAVISHAVTKGLDPTAPLRPSGIDWLGDVPEHWEVSRVKHVAEVKGRIGFRGYTAEDLVSADEGALVLGATEMTQTGEINPETAQHISWKKYFESPEIMLKEGMILFVQRGSTVGKTAWISKDLGAATINPSLIVLRDLTISPEFLTFSLMASCIQSVVKMQTSSTAIPMISQEQVGNYFQLIPPLLEQEEITRDLRGRVQKLFTSISKGQAAITLLKERRTALISAAVTGKIDVRDWQPRQPLSDTSLSTETLQEAAL